jgi:hypothetical protein
MCSAVALAPEDDVYTRWRDLRCRHGVRLHMHAVVEDVSLVAGGVHLCRRERRQRTALAAVLTAWRRSSSKSSRVARSAWDRSINNEANDEAHKAARRRAGRQSSLGTCRHCPRRSSTARVDHRTTGRAPTCRARRRARPTRHRYKVDCREHDKVGRLTDHCSEPTIPTPSARIHLKPPGGGGGSL